tara:strand:- start:31853 stop:33442 length:1590 start_codon:yes stop_codon:yes gene_type:complete
LKKKSISFSKTRLFSKLICDFIESDSSLQPFINSFLNINALNSKLERKKDHRTILSDALKQQYDDTLFLNTDLSVVNTNVSKLSDNNVYTITTGHQLNIFASPLFLIYKIISVISYTNYLNHTLKNVSFVPCFWMASEDHDFSEIQSCTLEGVNYHWELETQDCVGNLSSKSLLKTLMKIKKVLCATDYGKELFNIYHFAYSKNHNYANATRSLLTALFGDYGLVIIDGNHSKLKKILVPHLKCELTDSFVYKSVSKTNNLLKKKYKPEINPLRDNIFYLFNSIRSKIKFDQKTYFTDHHAKTWNLSELLNEINEFPERFSPNVFLRPLYQELIMPNILYLGGPSEIAYWIQLKKMFNFRHVDYPFIGLRSHFLILPQLISALKNKLGLLDEDLFLDHDDQIKKILTSKSLINMKQELSNFNASLFAFEEKIKFIKGFPIDSFYVFKKRLEKEFNRLEKKVVKYDKIKNKDTVTQIKLINQAVFPGHYIQERSESFIPYYIKYGKQFFDVLIKESSIFDNKYIILTEED